MYLYWSVDTHMQINSHYHTRALIWIIINFNPFRSYRRNLVFRRFSFNFLLVFCFKGNELVRVIVNFIDTFTDTYYPLYIQM